MPIVNGALTQPLARMLHVPLQPEGFTQTQPARQRDAEERFETMLAQRLEDAGNWHNRR